MTVLKLVPLNDPVLRRRTKGVARITGEHKRLVRDMVETVLDTEGIGLSANQVGSRHRIAVIYLPTDAHPTYLINPRLIRREEKFEAIEGCLSVPGYKGRTERFRRVTVRALGLDGKVFELEAEGILAHCIQHEVDHLDGKLYLERLIPVEEPKEVVEDDNQTHKLWRPGMA